MSLQSDTEMKSYYKARAPIYDQVYSYPERQNDMRFLEKYIPSQFTNLDILEVAAGTGYWSQFIISEAKSLLATDATIEALIQIKKRELRKPIETMVVDAYELGNIEQNFTGAFAGLWLSHVPRQKVKDFLVSLHKCIGSGATIMFIDNSVAQCKRLPLSHTDEHGNTYQDRKLDNGTAHRILKNFPTESELISVTDEFGIGHKYVQLDHFWLFQYIAR